MGRACQHRLRLNENGSGEEVKYFMVNSEVVYVLQDMGGE